MTAIVEESAPATAEQSTRTTAVRYPGVPAAMDGTAAVVAMETAASEAAGAYPITPSTQMGEGWAQAVAEGRPNVFGRRLLFFEPEGEHAAAAVTAGMAMVGLRSTNFSSGQGIVYMHESLYPAVGKRLTYVLNMACRAITKHALNVHAGHDDYHAIDDTGFFQLFAKDAQEAADLVLISHRLAELALNPGVCAQDGFLTSHVIESLLLPERELVREYLGDPGDWIDTPTPAQRLLFGDRRRRIPELFDLDQPRMVGVVQNQDSYEQGVAAQRPYFFDHVAPLADRAMAEYAALTGRRYRRASGYRVDDAEVVIVGQGSVVANAEAVADWLRARRGVRVGVVNLTMFRPFPADLLVELLAGKRAAVVLERVDQPLAVDPPLLRELRAAFGKAMENARAGGTAPPPHSGIPPRLLWAVPDFYSACFGLGSRDLQPGDLVAAVDNALAGGRGRRQVYLGIDFVRGEGSEARRLAPWQQQLASAYPRIEELALPAGENPDLLPAGALALRIHSVGGWGAITMGKNLSHTLFDLLGLHVKSNPKYGSEKKGQPTTYHAVFAPAPVRTNGELNRVDVVLCPDAAVFRHSDPLRGLADSGALVLQASAPPEAVWASLPPAARRRIRERAIGVFCLDGFAIARGESSDPALRFRMQGGAFQGAFFRVAPLMARHGLDETALFAAIAAQLHEKFGHRDPRLVDENLRVIRRGYDEVREVRWQELSDDDRAYPRNGKSLPAPGTAAPLPVLLDPERFACEVCGGYAAGVDPVADPLAALSVIPAATGVLRDLSGIRVEVPAFVAERCTGCGHCWTNCPDAAIPGLVVEIPDLLRAAATESQVGAPLRQLLPEIADRCRQLLRAGKEPDGFATTFSRAAASVTEPLELSSGERASLALDAALLFSRLDDLPVAVTAPFFGVPEKRQPGSGGLLAVTVNPNACKGCNLCVEVCGEGALVPVPQDEQVLDRLRRGWSLWQRLPDTAERFIKVSDLDRGVGVLHTLLLQKRVFRSMVGGDGACMGCGEKTAIHLVMAAAEAAARPRAARFVARLAQLLTGLEAKAADLAAEGSSRLLADARVAGGAPAGGDRERLARLARLHAQLADLRWRYVEGPTGAGRAALGIANSTGCSSVWGSTYPYNPYPYPWTNHLFQDAPSIGIGLFEGLMRKMADGFAAVRRAELELADAWDPAVHEPFFAAFDWTRFSDEEYLLSPPLLVVGGDGAMLDIGLQNLSRLLASGKPLKVVVLDTQVYSNTGGQACTSGFLGQVSDMAAWGAAHHGKSEQRKELALIAIAHRNAFVLQSSQASPGHLLGGVLRGLASRRPAVFNLYTPCQGEHAIPDDGAARAARLALESRAFPFLEYDPDRGRSLASRLRLDGNPAPKLEWPTYKLSGRDEEGTERTLELPLTTADWAATEPRFERHFRELDLERAADAVPFHQLLALAPAERAGKVPFLWTRRRDGALGRLEVSPEMVALAEDRQELWGLLREMAGAPVAATAG